MKKFLTTIIFFTATILFSQQIIFEKSYSEFPFKLQITNSGIYSIASFDVNNNVISFSSFTEAGIYQYRNGKFYTTNSVLTKGTDFTNSVIEKEVRPNPKEGKILLKKNYYNGLSTLTDAGGKISGANGINIIVSVPNRNELILKSNLDDFNNEITFNFPGNLACADLIGIDKSGNLFIVIEKYLSEIPLKVEREVYTISKSGILFSRLILPNIKYLYTLKDLQIDAEGNLYHLLSYTDRVAILKWDNLTKPTKEIIKYPAEYNKEIHFNDYVTTDEVATQIPKNINTIQSGVSRTTALKIADTYVVHQYQCTSDNLAPSDVTAPDGDVVRTPSWLKTGWNARIPYKWGGFNTVAQFDDGISSGKYAGDINTNGVSSYAYGVDCSGYVSRCWQLSYHASTSYMPNITTQYASWDDLKPGDAVHKVGHVRLFVERNVNGSLKIVEASARGWDVSYWSYATSDLSSYTPRYYNNMETNYNSQRPVLVSAELKSENLVELKWSCDTIGILGYRVYASTDGVNWNIVLDENNCKTTYAEVTQESVATYYRISSVKNDSPDFSESNWSNVLGTAAFAAEKKVLVVDGFERESGSWEGAGHTFVLKYGKALEALSQNFISIQNSELLNNNFQLKNFDHVFWILGDESTVDETFSSAEQSLVKNYLESGGNLFVSGSEIGWDLDYKGSTEDKSFYNNYLKANYLSDDADNPTSAYGIDNTAFDGCSMNIGQTYEEDYPDEIEAQNGSSLCMKYANGKGAGVQFTGFLGTSNIYGSLIYLAFPLETTADDNDFNQVIEKSITYFNNKPTAVADDSQVITTFNLEQNYPNPFNPSTEIRYEIGDTRFVSLKIFNSLGQEVVTLVNKVQTAGSYQIEFTANSLSSGIYFYQIRSGNFFQIKKMMLIK